MRSGCAGGRGGSEAQSSGSCSMKIPLQSARPEYESHLVGNYRERIHIHVPLKAYFQHWVMMYCFYGWENTLPVCCRVDVLLGYR